MNKAIVLGSDAVNALGLVQSLGREGVYVIAVLDCKESVLISKSKYAKEIINVTNFEQGIDIISEKYLFEEPAVIFPAGDGAALAIEKSSSRLRGKFLFEHIVGEKGFEFYMQKQNQISIAKEFNLNVPLSIRVQKDGEAPDKMVYPCIVKPLVSCEGDKRDIHIAEDKAELNEILKNKINFSSDSEASAAYQRKILVGLSEDVRVIIIKLADRLHNMRTLEFQPVEKQKKISQIELSEKVDLAFTFISDIENGKKWVSPETIEKLSKVLDVEVYQFFLPEDYVFQEDKSIESFANEINESIRKIELRYLGK